MLEVVPRIELVKRHAEKEYKEANRIILNSTGSKYHQEVLNYLGLTERVLTTNDASFIAEELITPSLAGIMINPPPWACSYVREALIGMADNAGEFESPYGRRIYISRNKGKTRRVIQEERIIEVLTSYGFTVVYPENLSVAQQIKMFSEVEAVVSPHGAALTNTIFCSPGTRVIELFSPGYNPPCYWIAAAHCDLQYRCIVGEPLPSPVSGGQSSNADILLDEYKLKDTLQSLRMG
jgi:capsular polysaccharide biosynthesis protein